MFTETSEIQSITIDPNRGVVVTRIDKTLKNGVVIASQTHIYVIAEGASLTGQPERVQQAAAIAWDATAMAAKTAAIVAQATAETAAREAALAKSGPLTNSDPTVSDLQIRLALTEVGLRVSLEAAVAQADQNTKDWYAHAKNFKRHDPMVLAMAQVLQVTDAQLDALWALAATK